MLFSCKGGYREDIDMYVRSRWEANYARYLNWLKDKKEIVSWEYEPQTFEFYGIKRGNRFYTPDFKIVLNNGKDEYHEIKGYLDARSKTKLKRMNKYYPGIKIMLIDAKEYKAIRKKICRIIPNWEEPNDKIPESWCPIEEEQLRKMWEDGVPTEIIAEKLKRTKNGISVRAQRLGLKRNKKPWRTAKQKFTR